ncbi:MAG: hypothetical protein ACFB2W_19305 [Leptolyngbyaceae cyanobacterium]
MEPRSSDIDAKIGASVNERMGTVMARLHTSSTVVNSAINARTGSIGARAVGHIFGKSHIIIIILCWSQGLTDQAEHRSLPAPEGSDVNFEEDEVYTRVGENLPPVSHRSRQSTPIGYSVNVQHRL